MRITTFATLINQKILMPSPRTNYIAVDRNHLVDFLRPLLREVNWTPIGTCTIIPMSDRLFPTASSRSALEHYVTFGFYEHRMPYEIEVDDPWYLPSIPTWEWR